MDFLFILDYLSCSFYPLTTCENLKKGVYQGVLLQLISYYVMQTAACEYVFTPTVNTFTASCSIIII